MSLSRPVAPHSRSPLTLSESIDVAPRTQDSLAAHGLLMSFRKTLLDGHGVVATSSFSGMGTAEVAVAMLSGLVAGHKVTNFSASDSAKVPRLVLKELPSGAAPEHVFGDVLDRLPSGVRTQLENPERLPEGI